ncbi:hypothetical protein CW749_15560 [Vibrio sp. vnigr-6D03]|uniref:hypothetical protein n=1 Tax=Vibrio sp. vnigr-6D03 TaxID=2058088 RepID=UPI000C32D5B7|nr:hypothetical protein [Vibrio sp. vnigr-6D03]PKF78492.1 hypothetical protein CW749_15560 [Vibrio sp. vnigr-6D03]
MRTKNSLFLYVPLFFLVSAISFASHLDRQSNGLVIHCDAPVIEYHQTIGLGNGTTGKYVNQNLDSSFIHAQPHFDAKAKPINQWLITDIQNLGVDKKCAEYLVSRGEVSVAREPDLLAYVTFTFKQDELTQESMWVLDYIAKSVTQSYSSLQLEKRADQSGNHLSLSIRLSDEIEAYLALYDINPNTLNLSERH